MDPDNCKVLDVHCCQNRNLEACFPASSMVLVLLLELVRRLSLVFREVFFLEVDPMEVVLECYPSLEVNPDYLQASSLAFFLFHLLEQASFRMKLNPYLVFTDSTSLLDSLSPVDSLRPVIHYHQDQLIQLNG